ncbi:MAG: hypothetical protein IT271_01300 [Chitinophagales bacterium]|nr:hypothetical protein [Chitinophagales bacterium]
MKYIAFVLTLLFFSCNSVKKVQNIPPQEQAVVIQPLLPEYKYDKDSIRKVLDSLIIVTDNWLKNNTQNFGRPVYFATYSILRKHFNLGNDKIYYSNTEDVESFFFKLYDGYFRDVSSFNIPEDTAGVYDFTKRDSFDVLREILQIPGGRMNWVTFCHQMPIPSQAFYILYEYSNKSNYQLLESYYLLTQIEKNGCATDTAVLHKYLSKLTAHITEFTELRADGSIINDPALYVKSLAFLLYANKFEVNEKNFKYLLAMLRCRTNINAFSFRENDVNGEYISHETTLHALWAMCEWRSKL